VRTVAHRSVFALFAAAEIGCAGFVSFILVGKCPCRMASIAEWLSFAFAATAQPVAFACFNFKCIWCIVTHWFLRECQNEHTIYMVLFPVWIAHSHRRLSDADGFWQIVLKSRVEMLDLRRVRASVVIFSAAGSSSVYH
jgi:hypothetical protein